jgi:hypothetical protein
MKDGNRPKAQGTGGSRSLAQAFFLCGSSNVNPQFPASFFFNMALGLVYLQFHPQLTFKLSVSLDLPLILIHFRP